MLPLLNEVRILREEGKLHRSLLIRTRMLFVISLIMAAIVGYNIIERGTDWRFALGLAVAGLVFGMFIFTRMNPIQWNEEQEVIETGRMDMIGWGILILYIAIEVGLRTFLKDFYPASAIALLLSCVFGVLLGRVIGTIIEIHRVYLAAHRQ